MKRQRTFVKQAFHQWKSVDVCYWKMYLYTNWSGCRYIWITFSPHSPELNLVLHLCHVLIILAKSLAFLPIDEQINDVFYVNHRVSL